MGAADRVVQGGDPDRLARLALAARVGRGEEQGEEQEQEEENRGGRRTSGVCRGVKAELGGWKRGELEFVWWCVFLSNCTSTQTQQYARVREDGCAAREADACCT